MSDCDVVYAERDRLVAALSKSYPAHLAWHDAYPGDGWDDEWRNIVCIHLPTGQVTWHIHERELPWFAHLGREPNHWDGHDTAEKYARLERIAPA